MDIAQNEHFPFGQKYIDIVNDKYVLWITDILSTTLSPGSSMEDKLTAVASSAHLENSAALPSVGQLVSM